MEVTSTLDETCNKDNRDSNLTIDELPEHINDVIDNIAAKESFEAYEILPSVFKTNGGNFMGELFEVNIKGQTKSGANELNLFIKNAITITGDVALLYSVEKAYVTECFIYKELFKVFSKLQDDAGIPIRNRYSFIHCYDQSTTKAIIMENIAKKGYHTLDRFEPVTLDYMDLAIKQLAKYHAMTFVIQKLKPEFFKEHIYNHEHVLDYNEHWTKFTEDLIKITISFLSEPYKNKMKLYLETPNLLQNYIKLHRETNGVRVLCHGDVKVSNVIFKKEHGVIKDLMLLDYQAAYYGNPTNDIIHFIYSCTDRKFREKNMKNLIDSYYKTIKDFLKYFNIDIKEAFPSEELDRSLNKRKNLGLMYVCMFYPFFYTKNCEAINFNDSLDNYNVELDPEYVRRIEEVIDEFHE